MNYCKINLHDIKIHILCLCIHKSLIVTPTIKELSVPDKPNHRQ